LQVFLAIARLGLARRRGDLPAAAGQADRLLEAVEAADAMQLGPGEDLRALAVISLGIAEVHAARLEDADRHLEQGVALARRIGRPYLELAGLAHGALVATWRSYVLGERRSRQAIELARRHGWGEDQNAGVAYALLGGALVGQGRLTEAEPWLERAAGTLRTEAEPAAGISFHFYLGLLELARGRNQEALADFQAAERLAGTLVTTHTLAMPTRARILQTLVSPGETGRAEAAPAGRGEQVRGGVEMRAALASLRLARHDPQAAATALAPVLDGSVSRVGVHPSWQVEASLLEAIARDALGDQDAAGRALERALDAAAPDRLLISFLVHPAAGLLERHARQRTAHGALIAEIMGLLAGISPLGAGSPAAPTGQPRSLREPLSQAETRVLRYLPTNLTAPEIAGQLSLSVNTVRTHVLHLYDKLGAHRRTEAVERARALGLLAPSTRRP
jgi:LuxR family maltose regulon positive regulatory protein